MGYNQTLGKGRHARFSTTFTSSIRTIEAERGSVASSDRIVCIPLEMGTQLRDSDGTEFHAVFDEQDTHGACTGGVHARNTVLMEPEMAGWRSLLRSRYWPEF